LALDQDRKEIASKPADLKRQHERAVGDELLKALDVKAAFKRLGDDECEPDIIHEREGGRTLGIEVASPTTTRATRGKSGSMPGTSVRCLQKGNKLRGGGVIEIFSC
jgi:hypothetical protein